MREKVKNREIQLFVGVRKYDCKCERKHCVALESPVDKLPQVRPGAVSVGPGEVYK